MVKRTLEKLTATMKIFDLNTLDLGGLDSSSEFVNA